MAYIVDLVLILIFSVCVLVGWKRGFIKTVMSLITGILSFLLAYIFASPVAGFLNTKLIYPFFSEFAKEKLYAVSDSAESFLEGGANNAKLVEAFEKLGLDYSVIAEKLSGAVEGGVDGIASAAAEPLSNAVSFALAFIGILILSFITLKIITAVLDLAAKLPVINKANTALGIAFGAIEGAFIVCVIATVAILVSPYVTALYPEAFPESLTEGSFVLGLVDRFNPIELIFKKLDLTQHLIG